MASTDKTIFSGREDNPLEKLNKLGTMFNGSDPSTYSEAMLDPFVSGYAMIYWVKLPAFFEKDDDLKYFKVLTQKVMTSFSAPTDIDLVTTAQNYGFAGNEVNFVTQVNRNNTDFSIGFKEYSGLPVTKMFDKWITYIRDKNTGIALYPKVFDMEYSARNHSATLLYIVLRPDVTNTTHNVIEKAILYSNVVPLNIPMGYLSYDLGSQDSPAAIDITFKGVPLMGKAVDDYAAKILKEEILTVSEDNNNGQLFLDSLTEPGDENTTVLTSGILKDIYNPDK